MPIQDYFMEKKHRKSYRWYINYTANYGNNNIRLNRFYLDFKTKQQAIDMARKIFEQGVDSKCSHYVSNTINTFYPKGVYVLDKLYIPCGEKVVYWFKEETK